MSLKEAIPSMFHRRLLLLLVLVVCGFVVLGGQLFRLTVVQGSVLRDRAESRLIRERWTPTIRGHVLDRKARVLARDRAGFNIVVDYRVITGAWAETQAMYYAKRSHIDTWRELSREERGELADQYLPVFDAHLEAMWDRIARETGTLREEVEERKAEIINRVTRMHKDVTTRRKIAEFERKMARAEALVDIDDEELEGIRRRTETEIREQESPHVIAARVSDDVGFLFLRLAEQQVDLPLADPKEPTLPLVRDALPGLQVWNVGDREYPLETMEVTINRLSFPGQLADEAEETLMVEGVATHLLGRMRGRHFREDVDRRSEAIQGDPALKQRTTTASGIDRGRYFPTDPVGFTGLERDMEDTLRGLRGVTVEYLDTGIVERTQRTDGIDVNLTVDAMLQARIQAIMTPELGLASVQEWHGNETLPTGTHLNGAAVVLDIDTAEILAMVSMPSFTRETMRKDALSITNDGLNKPWVNRAINQPYPPGSIVKAIVATEAVSQGKLGLNERIACTGRFFPNIADRYRCWIYKRFNTTHSAHLGRDPDETDAIMVSCNIFFYTMGRRLGVDGMTQMYRRFGVGQAWNLGVGDEYPGKIGAFAGGPLTASDAILIGIGQGPVVWTPLHAADAYATLARAGVRIKPNIVVTQEPPDYEDLGLNPAAVHNALEGLRLSVNSPEGTGHHITMPDGIREPIFNAPGVMVWGKTGTAQAPNLKGDPDGDGPQPEVTISGDHSWFVVLVGSTADARPKYVISVVMEYAGSGGKVSGPIANQIIHALIAEGYL